MGLGAGSEEGAEDGFGAESLRLRGHLQTPMTAHNFILLCKKGYYDNTEFHRSIKNFMVRRCAGPKRRQAARAP